MKSFGYINHLTTPNNVSVLPNIISLSLYHSGNIYVSDQIPGLFIVLHSWTLSLVMYT